MTAHPTDAEKLQSVLTLAFNNDRAFYDHFCEIVRESVPEAHAAVLRGSAITGRRHTDGAPFDADGPGTSDLDLTLVGAEVLRYFSAFWIPGMHSKPLSDEDPDIAPELTPLAPAADEHGQASREHPGHARLDSTLSRRRHEAAVPYPLRRRPGTVTLRVLSYNIFSAGAPAAKSRWPASSVRAPRISSSFRKPIGPSVVQQACRKVRDGTLGLVSGPLGGVHEPSGDRGTCLEAGPMGQACVPRNHDRRRHVHLRRASQRRAQQSHRAAPGVRDPRAAPQRRASPARAAPGHRAISTRSLRASGWT